MKGLSKAVHEPIALVRTRQVDPIEQLYHSEARHLRRYFRRKTGGHEDAADLVQDAFAKLVAAPTVHLRNPAAYLQRIASNLVSDWFRDRWRASRSDDISLQDCAAAVSPTQEDLCLFEDAIGGLSEKTRTVFLLKRVEGLTYQQIAKQLNISAKTVEYHMTQAIGHIDRFLGEQ